MARLTPRILFHLELVSCLGESGTSESLLPRRLLEQSLGNELKESSSSSPRIVGESTSLFLTLGLTSFLKDSLMEEGLRLDLLELEGVHSLLTFCCMSATWSAMTGAPAMVMALAERRPAQVLLAPGLLGRLVFRLVGRLDTLVMEPARVSRVLSNISSAFTCNLLI